MPILFRIHLTAAQQSNPLVSFRQRFPWLLCNIGGGIAAAFLSGLFEAELQKVVALALFIPVVLALAESVSIQSVSLALQTFNEGAERERNAIEARIALGASRFEAFSGLLRQSLRTATTPLLNTMAIAGIVTLPGMMAGQILAGADPGEAAKYQIMIMFVLTGAAGLGAFAAALGSVLLLTDARHRLRLDRLTPGRRAPG